MRERSRDVTDYVACEQGVVSVENEVGLVEVLINNAGISRDAMTATTGVATAKIISRKVLAVPPESAERRRDVAQEGGLGKRNRSTQRGAGSDGRYVQRYVAHRPTAATIVRFEREIHRPIGGITMDEMLDSLVIGGGPAGLTAAIYLGRFRRRVLLVDQGWSRAAWITRSHNLPGFPEGVVGSVLLDRMRGQARLYGATLQTGVIDSLQRSADGAFTAQVDAVLVSARTVILATGVLENKPPLGHVADAVKRGVMRTCPICDGYESIDRNIAVLGNGEHAAAEALFLRTYTNKLTLLLADAANGLSQDTQTALGEAGIKVSHVAIGSVRLEDDDVTALCTEDGRVHRFDVVYSAFGTTSQTQLAKALQARLDDAGRLFVDAHQQTSINGLFAAGDLVRGLNQISVANGEAAIAATAIHNRLPKRFA